LPSPFVTIQEGFQKSVVVKGYGGVNLGLSEGKRKQGVSRVMKQYTWI
jgi:hypothetical protein